MSYKTTLLPDYIDVIQNTSIQYYNNTTTILSAFSNYIAELKLSIDFERAKTSTNVLSEYGKIYNLLNSTNFIVPQYDNTGTPISTKKIDDTFKLFFIEKYQSLSEQYKTIVSSIIQNNNLFVDFSDDVGIIGDTTCILDNNTSPYYDVYQDNYFILNSIPTTILNKISKPELSILKSASYTTDSLLRYSLSGIVNNTKDTATTPHGNNLVTDILYFDRINYYQLDILDKLQLVLGNLYEFISFFKQLNPKDLDPERKSIFYKYTITNMEGISKNVDILKNDLNIVKNTIKQTLA
jgi:hypothetical protein